MPSDKDITEAEKQARLAILQSIPKAVEALGKHNGPAQADGLAKVAEAYAWVIVPNQSH